MRNPADLPRRTRKQSRLGDRGRTLLIIVAVAIVVLLLSARFISGFFVDYWWHQSVHRTDVFWGVLGAKFTMFAMFAGTFIVVALLNLIIADRLAPTAFSANTHPLVERFHEFFGHRMRMFRFGVAVLFGLLFAMPATGRWQDWLMFRNSKSFGINDPHFGNDVGFYMFKLPFITFVLDWLFLAVLFITVLVVATHVLSGGILLQPPRPKVRRATKAHIAVLLGLLAILKAGDYWVTRYELTTANRGAVRGITYAVDNAQLPAVLLLALIALLTAGLFLSTLKTDRWRPAVVASGLWAVVALIGGVIYPSAVQSLIVNPNQKDKEAKYIAYNIDATRHALGIDKVSEQPVTFGDLTRSTVAKNVAALQDIRLIKPDGGDNGKMVTRFQTDKGNQGQAINDLDPDRYEVDGTVRQVIVGARELDLNQVGNKSWQGTHLITTHGCGLVMAPAGQIAAKGNPAYREDVIKLDRPELYFSPSLGGYAVVGSGVTETPCPGQKATPYAANGGVPLSSSLRRLAFALDEWDYNLLGSSAIDDNSQLLTVRNPRERVQALAPFLSFDGDPYPVAVDGRVVWVIDGYTTSSRYPYAQGADLSQLDAGAGLKHSLNYVRNSVKAVVDAYDGSVTLYVNDRDDPVLQVWQSAFPDLFSDQPVPAGLADHLRYPEELFRLQTAAYSKYRLDASRFFERDGAWSVALAAPEQPPSANSNNQQITPSTVAPADESTAADAGASSFPVEQKADRFVPYYAMFHPTGNADASFSLFRPFQPFSVKNERKEMVAYMTADSTGGLVAYTVSGTAPEGPNVVGTNISTDKAFTSEVTLLGQAGSEVVYGDLQMIPVGDSLLWMRPVYVESSTQGQPQVRLVVAYYNGEVGFGDSLEAALAQLFPGLNVKIGDVVGGDTTPVEPGDGNTDGKTAQELLQQAQTLFDDADAALKKGDLGTYKSKIDEAQALVAKALALLDK